MNSNLIAILSLIVAVITLVVSVWLVFRSTWQDHAWDKICLTEIGNIYLHYVLDLWSYSWRKKHRATGDIMIVRYAVDVMLGFQSQADANRFREDLDSRLAQFALQLHPHTGKRRFVL